ncbi:MAG: hypothetical protein IKD89_00590 [Clostridia bacterium]|nr:hypothetical protein [Clostridia bacterium]
MKRIIAIVLAVLFLVSLAACGGQDKSEEPEASPAESAQTEDGADESVPSEAEAASADYGFEGTVFTFDGEDYDMTEIAPPTNAVMSCTEAGKYIVVEGHINPQMGTYAIFNRDTREFESVIYGTNFIWYDDDLTTGVYADRNDICVYDGTVIASLELSEREIIYDLSFTDDRSAVNATILDDTDERTETIPLGAK